jgi:predicted metal-dependent enzyme (double-stranded beta helix superfamily)
VFGGRSGGAGPQAIREIVARAVADPGAVLKALGEPKRAEVHALSRAADLTILNVIWGPRMTVMPHNHNMWAIIGIYTGREDNVLWRRIAGDPSGPCCWTKMTAPMIRLAMGFPAARWAFPAPSRSVGVHFRPITLFMSAMRRVSDNALGRPQGVAGESFSRPHEMSNGAGFCCG